MGPGRLIRWFSAQSRGTDTKPIPRHCHAQSYCRARAARALCDGETKITKIAYADASVAEYRQPGVSGTASPVVGPYEQSAGESSSPHWRNRRRWSTSTIACRGVPGPTDQKGRPLPMRDRCVFVCRAVTWRRPSASRQIGVDESLGHGLPEYTFPSPVPREPNQVIYLITV